MDIVSIILCGLALLTAVVNTALFFREKKRTNTRFSALNNLLETLRQAVSDLKLDYKEAQEAANSVNDYASSLMNIFNYEPMEAAKKARSGGKAE